MDEPLDAQETQAIQAEPKDLTENTQPIEPDLPPLPAWILAWAETEEDSTPRANLVLQETEAEEPFIAPVLDEGDAWAQEETLLKEPVEALDDFLHAGDLQSAQKLIESHKNKPEFRQSASKTIRKHLSLDENMSQLWDIYENLNED
jgi:hypothetical protein